MLLLVILKTSYIALMTFHFFFFFFAFTAVTKAATKTFWCILWLPWYIFIRFTKGKAPDKQGHSGHALKLRALSKLKQTNLWINEKQGMTQMWDLTASLFLYYTFKNMYKIGPASETRHAMSWFTISVFVIKHSLYKNIQITEVKIPSSETTMQINLWCRLDALIVGLSLHPTYDKNIKFKLAQQEVCMHCTSSVCSVLKKPST